jgi:hypothetical protein
VLRALSCLSAGRARAEPVARRVLPAHPVLQLQRVAGNAAIARWVGDDIPSLGPGHALEPDVRRSAEGRFGWDLGVVRVHHDRDAEAAARAVDARAFTLGRDIVFGAGEYRPDTAVGRRLLAHELAHVAQQADRGERSIQRQSRLGESTKPASTHPDAPWQKDLDAILPGKVGLLEDIHRVTTLLDTIGSDELTRVVKLIRSDKDARALVQHDGVPGIIAIYDTLWATRKHVPRENLDLPAARALLDEFPSRMWPAKKREAKTPRHVFSEESVREAFVEFHRNALLDREDEQKRKVRDNCIQVVKRLVPQLFAADREKQLAGELGKLTGGTDTMPHAGAVFLKLGVADKPVDVLFKDGNGLKDAPEKLEQSAFDTIVGLVGDVQGWHVFGVSMLSGFHSATVFVHKTPTATRLFWADQWNIAHGEDFGQAPGAVSGFRRYDDSSKLDHFIEDQTHRWWTEKIHHEDSECAKRRAKLKKKDWSTFCKYPATLRIWHLRTK